MARELLTVLDTNDPTTQRGAAVQVTDYPAAIRELGEVVPRFFRGLQDMAESKVDTADDVQQVCRQIVALRDQLRNNPPLRPWILTGQRTQAIAEGLIHVMRKFVTAFGAQTPIEGQDAARTAQSELDALSSSMDELSNLMERWGAVSESDDVSGILIAMAADVYCATAADGLLDLDTEGRLAYEVITGRMPPEGTGLALQMHQLCVRLLGDEQRYHKSLASATALLAGQSAELSAAAERPGVLAELRNGWLQLADQIMATNAAVAAAVNDRQVARSVLGLLHTLFEGPGRRFAGLFLELVGKGTFETSIVEDGAGRLMLAGQDRDLCQVFYGLDKPLRIAYAHQSFEFRDDQLVLLTKHGRTIVTEGELLDHLLAAQECLTAVGVALQVAAQETDVDLIGPDFLASLGIASEDLATMVLNFAGVTGVAIVKEGVVARVDIVTSALNAGHVGILCSLLPTQTELLITVHGTLRLTPEVWSIDAEAVREQSAIPQGLTKEIRFVKAISRMERDGAPAMDHAAVEHWIARRTLSVCSEGYPRAIPGLRALKGFAQEMEFDDLTDVLRAVLRFVRLCGTGASDEADHSAISALNDFIMEVPPQLPFSSGEQDPIVAA